MRRYAMIKDPGLSDAFSYANNWDAAKIYGCVCDPGYSGPSCTERTLCYIAPSYGCLVNNNLRLHL